MKKVATALLSGILIMSMTGCIGGIKTPMSSSDSIGKNYETVMSEFSKAGFENITAVEVEDLTIDSDMNVGDVSEIEINKKTKFKAGARFGKKSDVIITYHTKVKAQAPIAVSECQEYDYKTLETMFKDAGFINVTSKEVFDLDPDDTDVEFNNVIKIGDLSSFEKDDKIPYDSEISIVCHKPFVKHKVSIHINFIKNLLFNKYDITFSIGNENMTLEHGKDADFTFSLKEGKYTLSFANVDSSDVKGEIELDLTSDVDVSYIILCYGDYVSVKEEYIDKKIPLADDEIKMVCDKWEYTGENYREVIKNLKSLGFTNIKEEPLYDIVWGITEEGSVENVTINGRDDYTLGTIFKKNSEIVVSYHLKEKKTETTKSEAETTIPETKYEKAYVRKLIEYDLYYMFDIDTNEVVCFGTNDTYIMKGTYTGAFDSGVDINWVNDGWHETFTCPIGSVNATLTDGNGFNWEYKACNVYNAQSVLDSIK